jgi:hypothetical protein
MRSVFILLIFVSQFCHAQLDQAGVTRVLSALSHDSMMGREAGTPYSDKAAAFIAGEFSKAGLKDLPGTTGHLQRFRMQRSITLSQSAMIDNAPVDSASIMVIAENEELNWKTGDAEMIWIGKGENFGQKVFGLTREKGNRIIFADTSFRKVLARFRSFPLQRFAGSGNMAVILTPSTPDLWSLKAKTKLEQTHMQNVVGMIPGKRSNEFVIFSAHYDHIGTGKPVNGDTIYNGANDDASGTTAVISLANHFSKMEKPERTILFVAFTAEESGGYGSTYFSQQLPPEQVVAMFNIEMIGTESKWGTNSAFITGYERSDFGKILQDNLQGSVFNFHPDPYPDQNLFFRSDNATLARLGVPAHTISTSKMDSEKYYHTVDDEIETLDLRNMTEIIKAIATSSRSIVEGKATPSRVKL